VCRPEATGIRQGAALIAPEREQLIEVGGCRSGEKIPLKVSPVTKQEARSSLVNNVSREQVERSVNVLEAFAVENPLLAFRGESFAFLKQAGEILRRRFAVARLVIAANDDVSLSPA